MIVKKPYAFLIKHFRIIHVLLSIFMIYLALKSHSIFIFFNDYVKNGYYTYSANLSGGYINFYMFIGLVFILILTSFIYLLMRWKKKSRLFYISVCVFYLILFIGFLVYFNFFNTILNNTLDVRTVRNYRDIIVMLYFPQYFFIAFSLMRAIGFDLKKFDFKKDLEELDIAEEDQEEIELTFGNNSYKYKRRFRRALREIRYYALENKFFFIAICSTLTLVIGFFVYLNVSVYDKSFNESEYFNVNGVVFKVVDSYITNVDLKGNFINSRKNYVVVKLSMENTNSVKTTLSTDSLRLRLDDKDYFPIYSKNEYFRDFGEGYYKNTLYAGEINEYLLIYEVPMEVEFESAVFRMVDNISLLDGEISAKYKDVVLDLEEFIGLDEETQYFVGDAISLEDSTLKDSEVLIESFDIADSFVETYTYCVNSCYTGKKIIKADALGTLDRTILKLDMEVVLDDELYINKYVKDNSGFISTFGSIRYYINEEEKKANVVVKSLENIKTDNVYIEVPEEIKTSRSIRLYITIRNKEYVINLAK